jgi:hypothetical protein
MRERRRDGAAWVVPASRSIDFNSARISNRNSASRFDSGSSISSTEGSIANARVLVLAAGSDKPEEVPRIEGVTREWLADRLRQWLLGRPRRFHHVEGITGAVSGYAGGASNTAHYEMVGTSTTGHAESVQVAFDPRRISYGRILQIYFSVAHDFSLCELFCNLELRVPKR